MEQAKVQTLHMIASIMHAMNIEGNLTKHSTTHVIHWRHQKTCQGSQIRPSPMGSDDSIAWEGPDEKQVHPKTTYAHMWKLQHEAIWGHNNSHQYLSMNFKRLHIKIALKIQESSLFHHDFSLPSGHCNGSTMLQCYHVPKTACFNQHCLGPNNCCYYATSSHIRSTQANHPIIMILDKTCMFILQISGLSARLQSASLPFVPPGKDFSQPCNACVHICHAPTHAAKASLIHETSNNFQTAADVV